MFTRIRQHPFLAALLVGVLALSATGLPLDQFIGLARLAIQIGISISIACLGVFVAPGLIGDDWFTDLLQTVLRLRLAQGWVPAQPLSTFSAAPSGVASVLLLPPRSIS